MQIKLRSADDTGRAIGKHCHCIGERRAIAALTYTKAKISKSIAVYTRLTLSQDRSSRDVTVIAHSITSRHMFRDQDFTRLIIISAEDCSK